MAAKRQNIPCGAEQLGMFEINGKDSKLAAESVEAREAIVKHFAKDPRSLWLVSDSGGKDSQAMKRKILELVPHSQIVIVHADLKSEVEHRGVLEHIRDNTPSGIPIEVVTNERRTLLDAALLRGKWFSARARYCTSDFKTGVLDKLLRRLAKERGATTVFNCIGIRANESRQRAVKAPLWINNRLSIKGRTVYDFLPVFHYTIFDVWAEIIRAGQRPHPAYGPTGAKNERLSCVLCVLGSANDLRHGAIDYPDTYTTYIAAERVMSHTMFVKQRNKQPVPVSVAEKAGVPFDELAVQRKVREMTVRRDKLVAEKNAKMAEKAQHNAKKTSASKKVCPDTIAMEF